jgi:DNA-binding CsgD family transcriptional regulator
MAQVGDDPDAEGAAVIAAYAMRIGMRGDLDGAWKAAERAIEAARRADAPLAEARGRQVLAQLTAMKDVDSGVEGLRSAAQLAAAVGDLDVQMEALTDISWALANAGRYEDALSAIEEVYAATLAAGVSGEVWPIYRARRIEYLTVLGRWPEAEGDIAAVEDSRAWTARFRAATLRAHQGRPGDAARLIDDALAIRQIDDPDVPDRGGVAIAWVSLALCRAEPSRALTLVREAIPLPGEEHMEAELLCLAVRACGMAADMRPAWRERALRSREAAAFVARLAELASVQGRAAWRPIRAQLLHAQAESARLTGGAAPDAWRAAGDAWLELDARERVAEARYREAEAVLLGRGPRRQAEAPLRAALAICDGLGTTPLRAEIEALAGRARIALDPAAARRRPAAAEPPAEAPADPHGLSSREREVLALLVAGRTNREIGAALFISPKTAGAHVSNILGKLGVANRVEAATVAHRLNLVSGADQAVRHRPRSEAAAGGQ